MEWNGIESQLKKTDSMPRTNGSQLTYICNHVTTLCALRKAACPEDLIGQQAMK